MWHKNTQSIKKKAKSKTKREITFKHIKKGIKRVLNTKNPSFSRDRESLEGIKLPEVSQNSITNKWEKRKKRKGGAFPIAVVASAVALLALDLNGKLF